MKIYSALCGLTGCHSWCLASLWSLCMLTINYSLSLKLFIRGFFNAWVEFETLRKEVYSSADHLDTHQAKTNFNFWELMKNYICSSMPTISSGLSWWILSRDFFLPSNQHQGQEKQVSVHPFLICFCCLNLDHLFGASVAFRFTALF